MKIKKFLTTRKNIFAVVLVVSALSAAVVMSISKQTNALNQVMPATFQPKYSELMAFGSVVSKNQESLHFQTGGKLVYLPFKEGDFVSAGTVIASLDSLEAQKNVTTAEANYRSAKSVLDLIIDNIHLFQYGNGGFANVGTVNETQTQKTARQQAEEGTNVAYDSLQKANKQLENTYIIAPFDGTIVHEDVKAIGVNITPAINFVLANSTDLIFQAEVSNNDISFINTGDKVLITLDNAKDKQINGTVSKIYPEKIKLVSGGEGYKVDITSDQLTAEDKFGMTGSVVFENKLAPQGLLVPSWIVLGNQYVWVMDQNTPSLRKVKIGETFGDKIQILEGLSDKDNVLLNPEIAIKNKYQII